MFEDKFRQLVHALGSVHPDFHPLLLQIIHDVLGAKSEAYAKAYASVRLGVEDTASRPTVQSENVGGQVVGEVLPPEQPETSALVTAVEVDKSVSTPLYAPLGYSGTQVCAEALKIPHGAFGVLSSHATGFRYPRSDEDFDVDAHFAVDVSDAADVKISHIDSEWQEDFGGVIVPRYESGILALQEVIAPADDTRIMSDIGDPRLMTNQALLYFLLKHKCLTNREYVLYMRTIRNKMLRAVPLSWRRGGWSIGRRLVFRSDLCPVGTVVISQW